VTPQRPGFVDDLAAEAAAARALEGSPAASEPPSLPGPQPPPGPLLLDAAEEPTGERIDTGWAPETLRRRTGGNTARNLIAAGLLMLLLGWLVLSAVRRR
jgi:LPXTG-motif cell wall-anchored protein